MLLFIPLVLCAEKSDYIVMFDRAHGMRGNTLHVANVVQTQSMLQHDEHVKLAMSSGYMAHMRDSTADAIRGLPGVRVVEKDAPVGISAFRVSDEQVATQRNAPWGIVRVAGNTYPDSRYRYLLNSGQGVDIFVLDTGVETEHPEFEGRARWGLNLVSNSPNRDEHGHGTHCAGIAGGRTFGVTKRSSIVAVKVLDRNGAGMVSGLLGGIDFVIQEHEGKKDALYEQAAHTLHSTGRHALSRLLKSIPEPRSVVNMSVGGVKSAALNIAIDYASRLGIHFSTAAGNEHENACSFSPGSSQAGITTGASTHRDTVASFSNFGACVDIFAPGVDILSSWIGGTQKIASGTSMATPHTTGALAAYLTYHAYTPAELKHRILRDASSTSSLPVLSTERLLRKTSKLHR